jgi:FHS family L-fucose permease-like MFS transporter
MNEHPAGFKEERKRGYRWTFATLVLLFFMWGFITVLVDSLVPRLKEIFELSYSKVILVQVAFFLAYGIVSIPAGELLSRIGYKKGMVVGLITMGLGCLLFHPAAGLRSFGFFITGYFTIAAGMTVLQVAANPYVAVLGPERTASSRLNLSQAFNSLGTTLAPLVGASFILSDKIMTSGELDTMGSEVRDSYFSAEASAVQGPFLILASALIGLAVLVLFTRLPVLMPDNKAGRYADAIKRPRLMGGVLGIFLYVGAEVAIGSFLVNYFLDMRMAELIANSHTMSWISSTLLGKDLVFVDPKGIVGSFVALYWGGAMVGRFIGSSLTAHYNPTSVLAVFATAAILLVGVSMATSGFLSMWSIILVGLFNSVMFPTIFTEALSGLDELKPQGSGLLCAAISGGALIPLLVGYNVDIFGFKIAFITIILCYTYILWFARKAPSLSNS